MATLEARSQAVYDIIEAHPFQRALQLLLPQHQEKDDVLWQACLGDEAPFYVLANSSPTAFIQPEVVRGHAKNRRKQTIALSIGKHIDKDDVYAFTTEGILMLSIGEESYRRLGLQGRRSRLRRKRRYQVNVDLRAKHFEPGNEFRDRVMECLSREASACQFACASVGSDGRSEGIDFSPFSDLQQRRVPMVPECSLLKIPSPDMTRVEDQWCSENLRIVHEWMGAAACQISAPERIFPKTWKQVEMRIMEWRGMILPAQVKHCVDFARAMIAEEKYPWIGINIWGCTDSPVSWGGMEHGYGLAGEHETSILLLPNGKNVVFRAAGCEDLFGK